jgi:hypothetical protein
MRPFILCALEFLGFDKKSVPFFKKLLYHIAFTSTQVLSDTCHIPPAWTVLTHHFSVLASYLDSIK